VPGQVLEVSVTSSMVICVLFRFFMCVVPFFCRFDPCGGCRVRTVGYICKGILVISHPLWFPRSIAKV
jgi:hypothetical protein